MTEDRDPYLQSLFAQSQQSINDEGFTTAVMNRTVKLKRNLYYLAFASAFVLLAASWFFSWPILVFVTTFSQVLGTEIVSISDSLTALILMPINNFAALLVLIGKILRSGWNRATTVSYTS